MCRSRLSRQALGISRVLGLALLLLVTGCGKLDSFAPVTPQGGAIVSLFVLELVLAFLVSGGVAAAVFYAMYRFRDRPGALNQFRSTATRSLSSPGQPRQSSCSYSCSS